MTDETRALTVYSRPQLTPSTWEMIERIAPAMHQARLFGVSSPQQAMAIMLKGFELGLSLTASFEFIQVVEGKPGLSPRGCLALIQSSPYCAGIRIDDLTDDQGNPIGCRVWMKRTNGFEYTVTWTLADAERAGLITKAGTTRADGSIRGAGNWEKYPANLCRWRAIGFCADVVFPDIIGGMKRTDELGANITPDGDTVVDTSWQTATPSISEPAPTIAAPAVTLNDLVARYGAEKIMEANSGRIPGTDEELQKVAVALEVVSDGV